MIQVEQHGPVTAIRMARGLFGRPLDWAAAYFVDGLLIDTGPACTADQLVRVLSAVEVRQVVLTHGHEERIGGLAAVQARFPDAMIYASCHALPLLETPRRLNLQRYRRLVWGMPQPVTGARPLDETGDRIYTDRHEFRVVETPGHSRDHICLFEPTHRWLFTGDVYSAGRDRAWAAEFDMFALVGSLRTLASLRPERLFAGSGAVRRTALPDLHEKIGYYVKLCQEVARLDAAGFDVPAIEERVFRTKPSIQRWTFGHFSTPNLIRACLDYNTVLLPACRTRQSDPAQDDHPISDSLQT